MGTLLLTLHCPSFLIHPLYCPRNTRCCYTKVTGYFSRGNSDFVSAPVCNLSPYSTHCAAAAAPHEFPRTNTSFGAFFLNNLPYGSAVTPHLELPEMTLLGFFEHRLNKFTASQNPLVSLLLLIFSPERKHLRPTAKTADQAASAQHRIMAMLHTFFYKTPIFVYGLSLCLAKLQ